MSINPRIASIENLIAYDPPREDPLSPRRVLPGRNIFGLLIPDQLRLAAQSLRLARRVAIVSGFYVPEAAVGETDGPPGAKVLGQALAKLGIEVDYITDRWNVPLFRALGLEPVVLPTEDGASGGAKGQAVTVRRLQQSRADVIGYLNGEGGSAKPAPTHLVSIERLGRGPDGRYRNMRGADVTATTAPLDELFLEGSRRGLTTIGIGDGGNEIGMGKVFAEALATSDRGREATSTVATDFCVTAGVSNWGAYGLAGALSVLEGRDLLPPPEQAAQDIERTVRDGGGVDGVTHRRELTIDGLELADSLRMLENIRRQIAPSPLQQAKPLLVGILGYGETGRAAAALLADRGHRVCISDRRSVTVDQDMVVAGVETGGHTIDFLHACDLVVASPGVRPDAPIRNALHRRGIPVMSELELAHQLGNRELIAVTGTVGKRTTVELMQRLFQLADRPLAIGGNRGRPLSALLCDAGSRVVHSHDPIAVAVSSFQLETVVHFRPRIAVMLNIDEAHMDRHRTIAEYVRIKSRIFMNHRPDDALILTFDDPRLRPLTRKHRGKTFFVSQSQEVDRGAWLIDGVVYLNVDGAIEEIGPARPPFAENLLTAVVAARLSGIDSGRIASAVRRLHEAGAYWNLG